MARNTLKQGRDDKTVVLHNFRGINNIDPADRLESSDLRDAVNVDIDRNGMVKRRPGVAQLFASTTARSIWSDRNQVVLYANGSDLIRIKPDKTQQTLYSSLNPVAPVVFQKLNDRVYLSDGSKTLRVNPDFSVAQWGLHTPSGWPVVTTTGSACCGSIKVGMTAVAADGEESGSEVIRYDLQDGQGLMVTAPVTAPEFVSKYRVYVSESNGETMYAAGDLQPGSSLVTSGNSVGKPLETALLRKIPEGEHVAYFNGRLFVAKGPYVYYSEPLYYGLYNPSFNYFSFAANVTMLAATNGGVFVAADATYKIVGSDPENMTQDLVFPYGSPKTQPEYVKSTELQIDGEGDCAVWLSDKGFAVATPSGGIINITEDRVAMPKYVASAIMFRQRDGIEQVVATGSGGATSNRLGVTDSWGVEVRRNGVII